MSESVEQFRKLIERVYTGVAHERVRVVANNVGVRRWTFNVYVDHRDYGLCIGRKGNFSHAMRMIFRAIAIANGFIHFAIWITPNQDEDPSLRWQGVKRDWDENKAIDLVHDIITAFKHEIIHISHDVNTKGHIELHVGPPIPQPLMDAVHLVLETYAKSYGKVFGIA